jgi:hypothetical protein
MTQIKIEIDALTGEAVERKMTKAEADQHAEVVAMWEAEAIALEAQAAAKESGQAKLAALGLTADEIAALNK